METIYYGIDVSKDKLQITNQALASCEWQDLEITNEIENIDAFLSVIDLANAHFVYEYTGNYGHRLTYCLELLQAKFSILSPQQSKGFWTLDFGRWIFNVS